MTKQRLKCAVSCFICFYYAKMTQTQTSRTNFATEQKVDYIIIFIH